MREIEWLVLIGVGVLLVCGLCFILAGDPIDKFTERAYKIALGWTAVCIVSLSAFLGLRQMHLNERWKRSEAAREMIDRMCDDSAAYCALRMAKQEPGEEFEYEKERFPITEEDLRRGLTEFESKEKQHRFIRRNFDALGCYLSRLSLFVAQGRVDPNCVAPYFASYVDRLTALEPELSDYFRKIKHTGADYFLYEIRKTNVA